MPNPGFVKAAHKPNGTPSADTPPIQIKKLQGEQTEDEQTEEDDDEEKTEEDDDEEKTEEDDQVQFPRKQPPPRRSNRLWLKTKFNFQNTPDSPVNLDED